MATPFKDGPIEGVVARRLKSFHNQRGRSGRAEPVDEIRHEADTASTYRME